MFKHIFFVLLLLLLATPSFAAKNISFGALTGGTSDALDAVPVNDINNDGNENDPIETGDRAFGIVNDLFYAYIYDASSSASEDSPGIIVPDDREDGTGAWLRVNAQEEETEKVHFTFGYGEDNFDITTGAKTYLIVPWDATITDVTLVGSPSGSVTIDLWVDSLGNFPPTSGDTITGGNEPKLSSSTTYTDSSLSGWSTSLSENDIILFHIDSVSDVEMFTLLISVEKD